jgi:thiamine-monophosphate kinase
VTTDAIVENVHFRRAWASWEQIGRKAIAVNLSDLAAMGTKPSAFTCALTVPGDVDDGALEAIARGMAHEAGPLECVLAGGNFSRGGELNIAITALGVAGSRVLRRDQARAGDAVLLIGDVGVAAAELRWLEQGRILPAGRSALLEPRPLVHAGLVAARHASCAIDVSDGLVQDLGHIARASNVSIVLDLDAVPRSARFTELTGTLSGPDVAHLLLAGGEDYALLVLAPPSDAELIRKETGGTVIGMTVQGQGVHVRGAPATTNLTGHDHFR